MIIAITGASGVGKTSILKAIAKHKSENESLKIFHFDDMVLPNWEEVKDTKKWQEEATIAWIDKLVEISRKEYVNILFEGSTDINFYLQGFEKNEYKDFEILLFDCRQESMRDRLAKRGQSDLYQSQMIAWLHYLRKEASLRNIEIIETDRAAISEIGRRILEKLN